MPTTARSHSQRIRQTIRRNDKDYDSTTRKQDAGLAFAKKVRSSARWRHLRLVKLAKAPLCENPFGQHLSTVAASEVDHVRGLRTTPALAFTMSNLQSLCHPCHARKTGHERREDI